MNSTILPSASLSMPKSVNPITTLSQGFGKPVQQLNKGFSKTMSPFGDAKVVSGNKSFVESNSIVAKIAFFILVVIVFVLLLRLGTYILGQIFTPKPNPILLDGVAQANESKIYQQDPSIKGAIPILRSVNESDGIEFTWASWLFVHGSNYVKKPSAPEKMPLKHVFSKGKNNLCPANSTYCDAGSMYPNNAPGVYLDGNTNNIIVKMNVFSNDAKQSIIENVTIPDIPINKWILLVVRLEGKNLDIYINGTIVKRHILNGVPRQNYDNVYVAQNGGFDGMISNLRYYNHALSSVEIKDLTNQGPNLKATSKTGDYSSYLSLNWYLNSYNTN